MNNDYGLWIQGWGKVGHCSTSIYKKKLYPQLSMIKNRKILISKAKFFFLSSPIDFCLMIFRPTGPPLIVATSVLAEWPSVID
jgi:hypothetical protein